MEILILVFLYYLSQNPTFAESVKPIMSQIKNSEEMLKFLNDLSKFSQTFSAFTGKHTEQENKREENAPPEKDEKKNPQSPTEGIADEFIQNILDNYLKKNN